MKKTKKDKTMKVQIIGPNKKVGVMVNGETYFPDDVVPDAGLLTAKSLIARGRAVPVSEKNEKASAKASK